MIFVRRVLLASVVFRDLEWGVEAPGGTLGFYDSDGDSGDQVGPVDLKVTQRFGA